MSDVSKPEDKPVETPAANKPEDKPVEPPKSKSGIQDPPALTVAELEGMLATQLQTLQRLAQDISPAIPQGLARVDRMAIDLSRMAVSAEMAFFRGVSTSMATMARQQGLITYEQYERHILALRRFNGG